MNNYMNTDMDIFKTRKMKFFKANHPDIEIPSSFCKLWSNEEEEQLLKELENGMEEEDIANIHQRTLGGIHSRICLIAYKMYIKSFSMTDIIKKTKLSESEIMNSVNRRQKIKQNINQKNTNTQSISVQIDMTELQVKIDDINKKMDKILTLLQNNVLLNDY